MAFAGGCRFGWAILVLLALPPGLGAGWGQLGGDTAHTAVAQLGAGPWDIANTFQALDPGEAFYSITSVGIVDTPYGPTGVSRNIESDACRWVRILDPAAGTVERQDIQDSPGCFLGGYSPRFDLLFVCRIDAMHKSDLRAYHAHDLTEAWRVTTKDVGFVEANEPADYDLEPQAGCIGPAIDDARGLFISPWPSSRSAADFTEHRIAGIDMASGKVAWSTTVPVTALAKLDSGVVLDPVPDGAGPNWAPLTATVTGNGVVIVGVSACGGLAGCVPYTAGGSTNVSEEAIGFAVAWLDENWHSRGMVWGQNDPASLTSGPTTTVAPGGSLWGAADGNLAYEMVGSNLLVIDPNGAAPLRTIGLGSIQAAPGLYLGAIGPQLADGLLLLQLSDTIAAIDVASGGVAWTWPMYPSWYPETGMGFASTGGESAGILLNCPGMALGETAAEPYQAFDCRQRVFFLDRATGTLRQVFQHPEHLMVTAFEKGLSVPGLQPPTLWSVDQWLLPLADSVLEVGNLGDVHRFVRAATRQPPPLRLDSLYPAPDQQVHLVLDRAGHPNGVNVSVNWGDGAGAQLPVPWPDNQETFGLQHAFPAPGTAHALVTVESRDGTTRTRSLAFEVGGAAPAGRPDRQPPPTTSSLYPAPLQAVSVSLPRPAADAVELQASWGDGETTRVPWDSSSLALNHTYRTLGPQDARFTTVFLDGSTATRSVTFDVGGHPPVPLTWVQKQFTAENQNVTFFVLGLLFTILGALVAAIARWRQRSRISRELRQIEAIRQASVRDPDGAMRDLTALRGQLTERLLRGRITNSQMQVLEARMARVVQRVQAHVLGPLAGRASPALLATASRALEDGVVDADEHATLLALLAKERDLTGPERRRLQSLLEAAGGLSG